MVTTRRQKKIKNTFVEEEKEEKGNFFGNKYHLIFKLFETAFLQLMKL